MSYAITRHNDYYAISRGRGVRKQPAMASRYLKRFIGVMVLCLSVILLHQYLHTQITVMRSQIASSQKVTRDLWNREQFLSEEIEALRHPQRIEQLASTMGMFPPRELKNEKFFSVQYAYVSYPVAGKTTYPQTALLTTSHSADRVGSVNKIGTLFAKLATYYQHAEAKPGRQ